MSEKGAGLGKFFLILEVQLKLYAVDLKNCKFYRKQETHESLSAILLDLHVAVYNPQKQKSVMGIA
ncbi:MAG TPA: hypothetical protein VJ917_06810, partial [Saprospiraceae bacterium]|nr:hypothetical protein [Saprospiraceae bacterium]